MCNKLLEYPGAAVKAYMDTAWHQCSHLELWPLWLSLNDPHWFIMIISEGPSFVFLLHGFYVTVNKPVRHNNTLELCQWTPVREMYFFDNGGWWKIYIPTGMIFLFWPLYPILTQMARSKWSRCHWAPPFYHHILQHVAFCAMLALFVIIWCLGTWGLFWCFTLNNSTLWQSVCFPYLTNQDWKEVSTLFSSWGNSAIWVWSVSHKLVCLNIWSLAGGAVLGSCGAFWDMGPNFRLSLLVTACLIQACAPSWSWSVRDIGMLPHTPAIIDGAAVTMPSSPC